MELGVHGCLVRVASGAKIWLEVILPDFFRALYAYMVTAISQGCRVKICLSRELHPHRG